MSEQEVQSNMPKDTNTNNAAQKANTTATAQPQTAPVPNAIPKDNQTANPVQTKVENTTTPAQTPSQTPSQTIVAQVVSNQPLAKPQTPPSAPTITATQAQPKNSQSPAVKQEVARASQVPVHATNPKPQPQVAPQAVTQVAQGVATKPTNSPQVQVASPVQAAAPAQAPNKAQVPNVPKNAVKETPKAKPATQVAKSQVSVQTKPQPQPQPQSAPQQVAPKNVAPQVTPNPSNSTLNQVHASNKDSQTTNKIQTPIQDTNTAQNQANVPLEVETEEVVANDRKHKLLVSMKDGLKETIKPKIDSSIVYTLKWWRYSIINHFKATIFVLCTVVPAFLVLIYTLFFYSPMYITEAVFAIKSNNVEQIPVFSAQSFLGGTTNKDIYVASAYIQSPDMFYKLDEKLGIKQHYSNYDFFSSLNKKPTSREIAEYWNSVVSVSINNESELIKLSVKAYTPKMSQDIENEILKELDVLINNMNIKAHHDAIKLAQDEVASAQEQVELSAEKLRIFRNEHTLVDPTSEASSIMSLIGKLEGQLAEVQTELNAKKTYLREDSIELRTLINKRVALEQQIETTRERIAGGISDKQQLSNSFAEYEKLIMKSEFSKKLLESAMSSLETARQISLSKSRYLVIIEKPLIPDESLWPKPFLSALLTFLITTFGFGIVSLIISAVREHAGI